jgi:hypothetical protein
LFFSGVLGLAFVPAGLFGCSFQRGVRLLFPAGLLGGFFPAGLVLGLLVGWAAPI